MGAIGVGLGEEITTRGILLIGLISKYNERKVWLYSTLLFSAMHIPNIFFGLPFASMIGQLILTFIVGGGFYIARRISKALILPIMLHGLWDSALFLTQATGAPSSWLQFLVYPLAIICLFTIFRNNWNEKVD